MVRHASPAKSPAIRITVVVMLAVAIGGAAAKIEPLIAMGRQPHHPSLNERFADARREGATHSNR